MATTIVDLTEVTRCCKMLTSDKATDRKESSVSLQRYLNKQPIRHAIDDNTDTRKKGSLTWDVIFQRVKEFVLIEIEHFVKMSTKKGNAQVTEATKNSRINKITTATSLLSFLIKIADYRGPRLKISELMSHVLFVLKSEFLKHVGKAYCQILSKSVLSVPKYRQEISKKHWQEMMDIFIKFAGSPPSWLSKDSTLVNSIIYLIISGSNCDLQNPKLFKFFPLIFKNVRETMNVGNTENILSALHCFATSVAGNCRGQVCELGERVFPDLLNLWNKPGMSYKDHIVPFFQLQMSIHHPLGTHTDAEGAWCTDFNHWKKCLLKLYETITGCIAQIGSRIRSAGAKIGPVLKDSFLDLAADVFHQVFWMYSTCSMVSLQGCSGDTEGSAAKRRRIDIGLHVLRDKLESTQEGPALIAWLQVLSTLLCKHPSCLLPTESLPLLTTLYQLQTNCKRQEVATNILKCLKSFATCLAQRLSELSKDVADAISCLWRKVWISLLKNISFKHNKEDGFALLTTLIMERLVEPDLDVWKVLMSSCPSRGSLEFLAVFIQLYPLPENYHPVRPLVSTSPSERDSYPFRHQLLDWLFALPEVNECNKGIQSLLVSRSATRLVSINLMAEVTVSLCLRNVSSSMFTDNPVANSLSPYCGYSYQKDLYYLETLYLESSFDEDKIDLHYLQQEPNHESIVSMNTNTNHIETLSSLILQRLIALADQLTEMFAETTASSLKERMDNLERCLYSFARYCGFASNIVVLLLENKVIPQSALKGLGILEKVGFMLKRIESLITERILPSETDISTKAELLKDVIDELHNMFISTKGGSEVLNCVLQKMIPVDLLDNMLQIYHGRWGQSLLGSTRLDPPDSSMLNQTASMMSDDDDDNDDDFDMQPVSSSDIDTTLSLSSSQTPHTTARNSYMSLRNAVARFLCALGLMEADTDTLSIREKIVEFLQSEEFDVKRDTDLQLYFTVSQCFAKSGKDVTEEDLNLIMSLFSQVMGVHRKDHQVCYKAVELLQDLAPKLYTSAQSKEVALHMIRAFWTLKGSYSTTLRLAVMKCMEEFLKADPEGMGTRAEENGNDNNGSSTFSLRQEFPQFLLDESHSVRMLAAHALGSLFMVTSAAGEKVPALKDQQYKAFDDIAKVLANLLLLPAQFGDDAREDEDVNRSVSMLSTLKHISMASPVCEKRAIALIFQALKEKLLDKDGVIKVLAQLSKKLGFPSSSSYTTFHLPFIIDNWFNHEFKIVDFPFRVLGFNTLEEFLKCHHDVILPQIILRPDKIESSMDQLNANLNGDSREYILNSFCSTLSCLLPWFAIQSRRENGSAQENGDVKKLKDRESHRLEAQQSFEYLKQQLTPQVVDRTMAAKFDELVLHLLFRMYEPSDEGSDLSVYSSATDPDPNVPYFTSQAIRASLDYLTSCFKGDSLVAVLCKTKDNIQKILLALNQLLFNTHLIYEKRRVLSMYRLFVLLVLRELGGGLGNTWAFFIRDVIYSLRRIITAAEEESVDPRHRCTGLVMERDLFTPCCNLLYHVCQSAVQYCSEELNNHLRVIVSTLVPYAKGSDCRAQQALALLSFLVIESKYSLDRSIAQLDPFPDLPQFKEISDTHKSLMCEITLEQDIAHFVSITTPPISRGEGLKHLRQRLREDKHQLHQLLDDKEYDHNAVKSVAHLVHELLHLSSCLRSVDTSTAVDVKVEIANCLGEIGAVDLSIVAMTGRQRRDPVLPASEAFAEDSINRRNSHIVGLLNEYMTDKSVQVGSAASLCLKQLLSTPPGVVLIKKFEECKVDRLLWYLEPFRPRKKKPTIADSARVNLGQDFKTFIGNQGLWIPGSTNRNRDHISWITSLTCALIESGAVQDDVLLLLSPVCKVKAEFADEIFPYLVHNILDTGDEDHRTVLSQQIQGFFTYCNNKSTLSSRPSSPLADMERIPSGEVNKQSIRSMLNVVNYLRRQTRAKRGRGDVTPWDNNFWLQLDYLDVAQAAQQCSAHFTALLYAEIWSDIQRTQKDSPVNITLPTHSQDLNMDEQSHSTDSGVGTSFQSLLLEIYSCIGEPDSVYGAGAGRLADMESRIRTYEHEEAWDKALGAYDLQVQEHPADQAGLLQALKQFGLYHVMQLYLQGIKGETLHSSTEIEELKYEAAWRNCAWDMDLGSSSEYSSAPTFHQSIFTGLCALQDNEISVLEATLRSAKLRLVSEVSHVSLESVRSVYPCLVRLQQLVELEQFSSNFARNYDHDSDLLSEWMERFPLPDSDFEFLEPVLALRTSMLQTLVNVKRGQSLQGLTPFYKGLVRHLEVQAKIARESNNPQVAEKALFTIRQLNDDVNVAQSRDGVNVGITWSWRVEEARLRWARDERETAMHQLQMLTKQLKKIQDHYPEATELYPQALGLYGSWLAETRSENPTKIIENYLEKAANLLEDLGTGYKSAELEAYLSLARYADTQYQNIVDYMNSGEFEYKQESVRKAKDECERLQKLNPTAGDRYYRTLEVATRIDEEELRLLNDNKMGFLCRALMNYAKTLQAGDKYDFRVFRLCSLWFDNANEDFVNNIVKESLTKIQTRKFLPLMYQLAARLGTKSYKNNDFQRTLNELIERVSVDHPHHTMFILLALANADRDHDYMAGSKKTGSKLARNSAKKPKGFVDEARVQAACSVIENIARHRRELVHTMKNLCSTYIELAYHDVSHLKKETGPFNMPNHLSIRQLVNLRQISVPTLDVKVDPLCKYDDIVYVARVSSTFCLAGGINLPKIITCIGSDGIGRRQLVKGKDDLRQDAVMEQVFGMVNQLLAKNTETRKRKLKIRTYKVIPLSQRSGMLEWCEGTTPLGDYLIGRPGRTTGAHQKYHRHDWTPADCRRKMMLAEQNRKTKAEIYKDITDNFHPVFRHFFLEKFSEPADWFERRLAYVKSCATCSIVGYIVGLGDRHVQNILVDCNTAELIHIDLGVAFEQGKILPTPETVPFRLSRDLVDGMGVAGVEGVYRRCCEKTMEVMRQSQEALVTILEVLLYDPIYSWTLSPEKKKALQTKMEPDDTLTTGIPSGDFLDTSTEGNTVESRNKMAERVLLRLKQKLNGVEDNVQLSVSGQVNHLIREATDPNNLCRLFPGWQPWL